MNTILNMGVFSFISSSEHNESEGLMQIQYSIIQRVSHFPDVSYACEYHFLSKINCFCVPGMKRNAMTNRLRQNLKVGLILNPPVLPNDHYILIMDSDGQDVCTVRTVYIHTLHFECLITATRLSEQTIPCCLRNFLVYHVAVRMLRAYCAGTRLFAIGKMSCKAAVMAYKKKNNIFVLSMMSCICIDIRFWSTVDSTVT